MINNTILTLAKNARRANRKRMLAVARLKVEGYYQLKLIK